MKMLHAELQKHWIQECQEHGALWLHDDNPKRPHALLASGKHSTGFFNMGILAENAELLDSAADDVVSLLAWQGLHLDDVDRVVGPAMGAITLAHAVARNIARKRNGRPCLCAYAEKSEDGASMLFRRTNIRPDEHVLCVEDVITTGGSVEKVLAAIVQAGGHPLPFVGAILNRSDKVKIDGVWIVSLIDKPMPAWTQEECLLCRQGSEAIRPKGAENWARLTAIYE